ncbi:MAG: hypothetical protein LBO09_04315 [Candidatus Peribacteria bacterium]|jgi:hypothetical protein|nr:hypothetical protein [Candidatus Peribacteria bacterium]
METSEFVKKLSMSIAPSVEAKLKAEIKFLREHKMPISDEYILTLISNAIRDVELEPERLGVINEAVSNAYLVEKLRDRIEKKEA